MSGFGDQNEDAGARYANIISGKFAEKVDADTPGAKSRVNKNQETVWEILHPSVSGRLKGCSISEFTFGNSKVRNLKLVFDCGDEGTIITSMPVESKYFDTFMYRLPNVPLEKEFKIIPYDFQDRTSGKKRQGLTIEVDGNKIEPWYTKENPGKKPTDADFEKDADGKMDIDTFKYFKAQERKFFIESIEKMFPDGKCAAYAPEAEKSTVKKEKEAESENDLPF